MLKINKHALDRIRARLDRIRAEQSEIYTHFKKRYNRHQLDTVITDAELNDLKQEVRDATAISQALKHVDMGMRSSRTFSY